MDLIPKIIRKKDNKRLVKRIRIEELKDVVHDMKDDKSSSPDGFNATFIKSCWEIVQKYLFKMVTKS